MQISKETWAEVWTRTKRSGGWRLHVWAFWAHSGIITGFQNAVKCDWGFNSDQRHKTFQGLLKPRERDQTRGFNKQHNCHNTPVGQLESESDKSSSHKRRNMETRGRPVLPTFIHDAVNQTGIHIEAPRHLPPSEKDAITTKLHQHASAFNSNHPRQKKKKKTVLAN